MKHEPKTPAGRQKAPPVTSSTAAVAPPSARAAGLSWSAGHALQSLQSAHAPGPQGPRDALARDAADLHATLGTALAAGAQAARVPVQALAAVVLAEQSLLAPRVDDRLALRFLPYPFWQATGHWLVNTHKDQGAEYKALDDAKSIDPQAAWQATRLGLGQVGGDEAKLAGHVDAQQMHHAMTADPAEQVRSLAAIVATDAPLADAMRAQDWRVVADLRAGPAAGALGYEDALHGYAASYARIATGGGDDETDPAKPPRKKRA